MSLVTSFTAPVAVLQNTSTVKQLVVDKQGGALNTQLHGDSYNLAYNGGLFFGANQSGVTTSAGLATTAVGLILSNPAGNTFNLVIRQVTGAFIAAPSTVTGLGLIVGYSAAGIVTHTTPLTPAASFIGGAISTGVTPTPTGKLDSAATLVGTPVWAQWFAETLTATNLPFFSIDLEGAIILPPGAYAAIGTTIAGPASGFVGSIQWEEVAV